MPSAHRTPSSELAYNATRHGSLSMYFFDGNFSEQYKSTTKTPVDIKSTGKAEILTNRAPNLKLYALNQKS